MNKSTSILREIVSLYANWDNKKDSYRLDMFDIPDFERHKIAAALMAEDEDLAAEATGPDNPDYEAIMLPALLKYLKDSTDREVSYDFHKAWSVGVTNYFDKTIQHMVDDYCEEMTSQYHFSVGASLRTDRNTGETYWARRAW